MSGAEADLFWLGGRSILLYQIRDVRVPVRVWPKIADSPVLHQPADVPLADSAEVGRDVRGHILQQSSVPIAHQIEIKWRAAVRGLALAGARGSLWGFVNLGLFEGPG